MTKDVLLSVRISRRLSAKLDRLAKLTDRTKSWLVNHILQDHADREIAFAEAALEGERSIDRHGTIAHEDIVRHMRARAARKVKSRRQAAE